MAVLVDRAERLVHLDELAVGQPLDDAGLDAVREDLPVVLLQPQADPVGEAVRERRQRAAARSGRSRSSR